MRRIIAAVVLALVCSEVSLTALAATAKPDYQLQQVVILSRHGLRAPLSSPDSTLGRMTPYRWPKWDVASSYLTQRGGILENYFGHYLQQWLVSQNLLAADRCPTKDEVHFYANSMQRTVATAQYQAVGAFPGCQVVVEQRMQLGTMDPIFNPILRDGSSTFKQQALQAINQQASENGIAGLNQRLAPAYRLIAKTIDYPQSAICKQDQQCDFLAQPSRLRVEAGKEPGIVGPLRYGTSIADALLLQYYEGKPLQAIAWGRIKDLQQLATMVEVKEQYNKLLFTAPLIAKTVSHNLLSYIAKQFTNTEPKKMTMLVGHDSNVASVLSALQVNPYQLPQQMETTPIGGKVAFERWRDAAGQDWLKIEYLYQSTEQLRQLTPLTLEQPPMQVSLSLRNCPLNQDGFCKLQDFYQVLKQAGIDTD